jgi:hypothetical protein
MVVHACNPSTEEVEAGGSQVYSQPGLHGETPSQNKKQNKTKGELMVCEFDINKASI